MAMVRVNVKNYGMTPLVPFIWAIIGWKVLFLLALPTVVTGWEKCTAAKAKRFGDQRQLFLPFNDN
jgi:hypothetical protein